MSSLDGKVIAITGAGGGIGKATAKLLASKGAVLSLADVDAVALSDIANLLRNDCGAQVLETVVDVRDSEQVNKWIESTVEQFGKLSGAANLAGTLGKDFGIKGVHEVTDEDFDFVMAVNMRGMMACQRAELQHIEDGGSIVNTSSIASKIGMPNTLAYTASKHAVIGLTKTAAAENGRRNVRVNAIAPGSIDTQMAAIARKITDSVSAETSVPLGRAGKPEEAAALIAFLLSDDSSFITGAVHTIDGGWTT